MTAHIVLGKRLSQMTSNVLPLVALLIKHVSYAVTPIELQGKILRLLKRCLVQLYDISVCLFHIMVDFLRPGYWCL